MILATCPVSGLPQCIHKPYQGYVNIIGGVDNAHVGGIHGNNTMSM